MRCSRHSECRHRAYRCGVRQRGRGSVGGNLRCGSRRGRSQRWRFRERRTDGSPPYSAYTGAGSAESAQIERYVPEMPLSKEVAHYDRLRRTVAAYRLVMGQPRQEDLVE